jgi:hypothetical protein
MKQLLLTILAASLTLLMAFKRHGASVPSSTMDTVKPGLGDYIYFNQWGVDTTKEWWAFYNKSGTVYFQVFKGMKLSYELDVDSLLLELKKPIKRSFPVTSSCFSCGKTGHMFCYQTFTSTDKTLTLPVGNFFSPEPSPIPDTTKPKYDYYYKLMIPANKFTPPLDTIEMVMQNMGRVMTVDRADELRGILYRQLNFLIGRPLLDSIEIKKQK